MIWGACQTILSHRPILLLEHHEQREAEYERWLLSVGYTRQPIRLIPGKNRQSLFSPTGTPTG